MEEMNFEEMRNQIALLKQKLDHQEIVNDHLLRETMRTRVTAINKTKILSFACAAFCILLYPLLSMSGALGNAFVIVTCVMMLCGVFATYYIHRPVDRMNLMTEDLATVAKVMAKFRKQYNQWLYYVTPSLLIPWLTWAVYEFAWKNAPEGMNHWLMALPLLVGAVIGLLISYYMHRNTVNAAQKIIDQIEEGK
jgi:H+/Cl- antiporter ClcA